MDHAHTPRPPLVIGGIRISPCVVLAPMAAVTHAPFRRICREIGGVGLVCTEQISTAALHYSSERTERMLQWSASEKPLSVQLFGADASMMADAAARVVDEGADIVDINMGCWVPKVCRQGAGAALLKNAEQARRVVGAVLSVSRVPVTVKMRAGWSPDSLTSLNLALELEAMGVAGFTLHGRTADQGFEGQADWRWIADFRRSLRVPVIGNGDIRSPEDALRMIESTDCHGVMVGRAAIGNPWLLARVCRALLGLPPAPAASLDERAAVAMRHARELIEVMGELPAIRHLRGLLPHYVQGLHGASRLREGMVRACTLGDVERLFVEMASARQPPACPPDSAS